MSARLLAAIESAIDGMGADPTQRPLVLPLVREAVATLAHGTMTYACEACKFEWVVWLGLGVEGPQVLRDANLYVPCAFTMPCRAWPVNPEATDEERAQYRHLTVCTGTMSHVRWGEDENFPELRLVPDDAPRFVVGPWYEQGDLVVPEPAMVAARRFHADRAG